MSSKKRGADRQITKDDPDVDDEVPEEAGTWEPADQETLKQRVIYKVKRTAKGSGAPKPAFNLLGDDSSSNDGSAAAASSSSTTAAAGSEEKSAEAEAEAPQANAFLQALGRQPGDWDCEVCTLLNKASVVRCISCEEWKAGHKPADDGKSASGAEDFGFGFGGGDDDSSASAASSGASGDAGEGGFSFGDSSAFSLGDIGGASADAGGFSFGSVDGDEAAFGSAVSSDSALGDEAVSFGVGSNGAVAELFKEGKAEPRGDDNDETVFKVHCRVYKMGPKVVKKEDGSEETAGMTFNEQGQGELRLNLVKATAASANKKTARALMRADMTHRLIVNAPLFQGMKREFRGDLRLQFCSNDLEGRPAVYLLKFATADDAKAADQKIAELIQTIESQ